MSISRRMRAPRCRAHRLGAAIPRRVVACTNVDGSHALVEWARALVHPAAEPLAPLLAPLHPWDRDSGYREFVEAELGAWPMPFGWSSPPRPRSYPARRRATDPEPLRQVGVVGDLAAALAQVPDRRSRVRRAA